MNSKMYRIIEMPTAIEDLESMLAGSYTTRFKQNEFKVLIPPPRHLYRLCTAKVICGKIEDNRVITVYVRPTLFELLLGIALALGLIYALIGVLTSQGSVLFFVGYTAFTVFYIAKTLWHMRKCLDTYCRWLSLKTNGSLFPDNQTGK